MTTVAPKMGKMEFFDILACMWIWTIWAVSRLWYIKYAYSDRESTGKQHEL